MITYIIATGMLIVVVGSMVYLVMKEKKVKLALEQEVVSRQNKNQQGHGMLRELSV